MKRIALMFVILFTGLALGQQKPEFKQLRYDDDFSYLRNDTLKGWYNRLKYSTLNSNGTSFFSIGGDIRFQYLNIKNEDWGDTPNDSDGYTLTRYLLHVDYHAFKSLRVFFQLQSSISGSRVDPSPVDENTLDIHQAFFDWNIINSERTNLIFRIGRQEMLYGSQRLIAVREFPNNRMAFDGTRLMLAEKNLKTDLFYTHPVAGQEKIFDDLFFNEKAKLWGSYTTIGNIPVLNSVDVYYLGLWKQHVKFDDATGKELRHSLGTRIWKSKGDWRYDFEAVYQFGSAGRKDINGWTISSNTSYQFTQAKFRPKFGLKSEAISGDRNRGDQKLQTFNALYPRGAYFGLAGLIGPSNLIDVHPSIELEFTKSINVMVDYDIFWRLSDADGIYAPNTQLIYSGGLSSENFVGTQLAATVAYQPNSFILIKAEGIYFDSGSFINDSGAGRNVVFGAITTQVKF